MIKARILAIEDEDDILDNIKIFLESENYEVITAQDGYEGIKLAKQHNPDLILCDIMMPKIDGFKVLEEISGDNKLKCIPFIFLTAKVERVDLRKGMEMGADDYIFKPFSCDELLSAIKTRLNKYKNILATVTFKKGGSSSKTNHDMEYGENIFIKFHKKITPIKIENIKYILAENQYTRLFKEDNKCFLIRKSLEKWQEALPPEHFIRIHRSTLINVDFIEKVDISNNGIYKVHMKKEETEFEISRRFLKNFKKNYFLINIVFLLSAYNIISFTCNILL